MKRILLTAVVMAGVLLAPVQAQAKKQLDAVLVYSGKVFHDQHTFKLKRAISQKYQNIDVNRYRVHSVRVVAKSVNNNATVKLVVGERSTDAYRVFGRSYNFDNGQAYTYDGVRIDSPWKRAKGRWQLRAKGTDRKSVV